MAELSPPNNKEFRRLLSQFFRFGVVGVVGFVVDASTLYFFVYTLDFNLYVGRLFSYAAAVTTTWLLNRLYTFQSSNEKRYREWAKFAVVNIGGGAVNYITYSMLILQYEFVRENPIIGVAVGSLAGMLVNFYFSKKLVFDNKK